MKANWVNIVKLTHHFPTMLRQWLQVGSFLSQCLQELEAVSAVLELQGCAATSDILWGPPEQHSERDSEDNEVSLCPVWKPQFAKASNRRILNIPQTLHYKHWALYEQPVAIPAGNAGLCTQRTAKNRAICAGILCSFIHTQYAAAQSHMTQSVLCSLMNYIMSINYYCVITTILCIHN